MTLNQYRRWYARREKLYFRQAFAIIQKNFKNSLEPITQPGVTLGNVNDILKVSITNDMVIQTLSELYTVVMSEHYVALTKGLENGTLIVEQKRNDLPFFSKVIARLVGLVIESFGGSKIVSIRNTFTDYVIDYLTQNVNDGKSIRESTSELYNLFGKTLQLYKWQIERIARTEVLSATNIASNERFHNSPVLLNKMWISATDDRVRHFHLEQNGEIKKLDEPFEVPVEVDGVEVVELLQYPGDMSASAGNVINCRCTIAPVTVRDDDGFPIANPNYVSDI